MSTGQDLRILCTLDEPDAEGRVWKLGYDSHQWILYHVAPSGNRNAAVFVGGHKRLFGRLFHDYGVELTVEAHAFMRGLPDTFLTFIASRTAPEPAQDPIPAKTTEDYDAQL